MWKKLESDKLRVLLTNDDGIEAAGILGLETAFLEAGAQVVVVAPDSERSASSHSVSLRDPVKIRECGTDRTAISGTPVDCVHLALKLLLKEKKPDIIISGINKGANLGCDINYSGTVGAAREGAMLGLPSFAVSLETFKDDPDFKPSANFAAKVADFILNNDLPPRTFLNVNLPDLPDNEIKGIKITTQGIRNYDNAYQAQKEANGEINYMLGGGPNIHGEDIPDSDIVAVRQGFISITPIRLDLTQTSTIEWLKDRVSSGNGLFHAGG